MEVAQSLFDFEASQDNHLTIKKADLILVIEQSSSGWSNGRLLKAEDALNTAQGLDLNHDNEDMFGWFPASYVRILSKEEATTAVASLKDENESINSIHGINSRTTTSGSLMSEFLKSVSKFDTTTDIPETQQEEEKEMNTNQNIDEIETSNEKDSSQVVELEGQLQKCDLNHDGNFPESSEAVQVRVEIF